jgi:MFS transporter, ACS family, hexuronate transporter
VAEEAPAGGDESFTLMEAVSPLQRWSPAVAMMLVSMISYIDRNALAILINPIMDETGLSARQYGYAVTAFSLAYMAGNPVWGQLLDRRGTAFGMRLAVAGWTLSSALHALASSAPGFGFLRALLGFHEGATFPGALRTSTSTLPAHLQGRGLALSFSGGALGATITPLVLSPIAVRFGWRAGFLFTGLLGLLWLLLWHFVSRRKELQEPAITSASAAVDWRSRALWGFLLVYALGSMPLIFILNMVPIYLDRHFGVSQQQLGTLLWIPPLGWECGYFFWGFMLDRATQRGHASHATHGRIFIVSGLCCLGLLAAPHMPALPAFFLLLFLAMFSVGGFIIGGISEGKAILGADRAALVAGLAAGSFAALAALVAPGFGQLIDLRLYASAFAIAALSPLLGCLLWRLLAPRERTPHASASTAER